MRKINIKALLPIFIFFLGSSLACAAGRQELRDIVKANNSFSAKFYNELRKKDPSGNIFYSPYSISAVFSMVYSGASSDTAKQIGDVFNFSKEPEALAFAFGTLQKHFNSMNSRDLTLSLANGIWASKEYRFKENFIYLVKYDYLAEWNLSDFEYPKVARSEINKWVSNRTAGKINDFLSEGVINNMTSMVLVNAIYFKGFWQKTFPKHYTKIDKFWISTTTAVDVRMMYQKDNFAYGEKDNCQILEMQYKGGDLSMVIMLPKDETVFKFLEHNFSAEKVNTLTHGLWDREVIVYFPKFKVTNYINIKEHLIHMGITYAFSQKMANFMNMSDSNSLYVSDAFQQSYVDVNEEGTEAAAATAAMMTLKSMNETENIPVFRADKPFIFLIRDNKSGSILFMGKITDPS